MNLLAAGIPAGIEGGAELAASALTFALLPAALALCTSFPRMLVTLGILRQGLGIGSLPGNLVLTGLAAALTFASMGPTLDAAWRGGLGGLAQGSAKDPMVALRGAEQPLRDFMFGQLERSGGGSTLASVMRAKGTPIDPANPPMRRDVDTATLMPAYALNELRVACMMGFRILLPFLAIRAGRPTNATDAPYLLNRVLGARDTRWITGAADPARPVGWGSDAGQVTDARDFVRRYLTPQSDYAEWYFPNRLTLDLAAARTDTTGTPFEKTLPVRSARDLTLPVLGIAAEQGVTTEAQFRAYAAGTRAPLTVHTLKGAAHLDITTASGDQVARRHRAHRHDGAAAARRGGRPPDRLREPALEQRLDLLAAAFSWRHPRLARGSAQIGRAHV